jgi:hypothetical protein
VGSAARPWRLSGFSGLSGRTCSGATRGDDRPTAVELGPGGLTVLVGHKSRRLAVQIEPIHRSHQRLQVRGGGGVAVQEQRQRLAGEHARCALLKVGLDAQLQRLGRAVAAEQCGKALCQLGRALGGPHAGRSLRFGCG